jgi:hypothetical protein
LPINVEGVEDQEVITSEVQPKLKLILKRESSTDRHSLDECYQVIRILREATQDAGKDNELYQVFFKCRLGNLA